MIILLYHNIVADTPKNLYDITQKTFHDHLRYLLEHGITVLSLQDVVTRLTSPTKSIPSRSVVLTFDDGFANHAQWVGPLLAKHKLPATFFVTVDRIGKDVYASQQELQNLIAAGMTIGSHGLTHTLFSLMDDTQILRQFKGSKEHLETLLETAIEFFSLPRGSLEKSRLLPLAQQAGYKGVCVSEIDLIDSTTSPLFLKRMPIKKTTRLTSFIKMVEENPWHLTTMKSKKILLKGAKKVMGIRCYDWLRKKILKDEYLNERPFPARSPKSF